jgi:hypothetical protein
MLYDFAMDIVYALMARWISCLKRFDEQAKYVDGIALETVFVHSSIVSQLDAAAEEAIATNTWFDALPLLPPSFGISDVAKLVSLCPSVQRALKVRLP